MHSCLLLSSRTLLPEIFQELFQQQKVTGEENATAIKKLINSAAEDMPWGLQLRVLDKKKKNRTCISKKHKPKTKHLTRRI